jgi:hypothetical protein
MWGEDGNDVRLGKLSELLLFGEFLSVISRYWDCCKTPHWNYLAVALKVAGPRHPAPPTGHRYYNRDTYSIVHADSRVRVVQNPSLLPISRFSAILLSWTALIGKT